MKSGAYASSERAQEAGTSVPRFTAELGTRLSSVIEAVGGLQKASSIVGVTDEQVGKWRSGKAKAPFVALAALAQAGGYSLDWLATGEGEARRSAEGSQDGEGAHGLALFHSAAQLGEDFVLLPRYEVQAAAGGGTVVHSEQVVDHLAFKASWVRDTLRRSPATLILIEAMGDSMEPTISNGDLLLIDTAEDRVRDNSIYVISVNGDLMVKRVQRRMTGEVVVMSDNSRYTPDILPPALAEQLRIVGLVVWHGGLI